MKQRRAATTRDKVIFVAGLSIFVVVMVAVLLSGSGGSHNSNGSVTSTTESPAMIRWIDNFKIGSWSACVFDLNYAKTQLDAASGPDNMKVYQVVIGNNCNNLPQLPIRTFSNATYIELTNDLDNFSSDVQAMESDAYAGDYGSYMTDYPLVVHDEAVLKAYLAAHS